MLAHFERNSLDREAGGLGMMITFEKIGRSDLGGDKTLTGPRADTPRGSFSTNSPLPYRKFTQALLDIGAVMFFALFILCVALSFPLALGILIFF
jgi:hypothetical protein